MQAETLDFRLLGPLEVWAGGEPMPLGGAKQRATLAVLLVHANEPVSTDWLIDALWGERQPGTAKTALQGYITGLRRLLEPSRKKRAAGEVLVTTPAGYVLQVAEGALDRDRFEALVAQGREALAAGRPGQAVELCRSALALWRGPALAEFAYDSWAQAEAERLDELRRVSLEERIEAELELGHHAELVGELEALVAEQPLRERPRRLLMLALYRAGRQADALAAYQDARGALVEELGIDPSSELRELQAAILRQDTGLSVPAPPARPPTNLPSLPTPLVGREHELAELEALFRRAEVRLVTLTGPGGTGKTRLALQAAEVLHLQGAYPDGVILVDLQAVRDPSLVLMTTAQALGATEDLSAHIADRQLLLLLDNFEQIVEAASGLGELLTMCPGLDLLVTSRESLHLSGEYEFPVQPLPETDAVTLFEQRARAVRPDFAANGSVAEICRRLDGLPLAVELAAARVRVLSPERILERLEHRLDLLTGGARDAPERQRTLEGTISWSYELLNPAEQQLFRRLGVFAGGCTLEEAEEVCAADLDTLSSLVEQSLLRPVRDRFAMLETIREYAAERLDESGEADELHRRHAESFAELAERAEPALKTEEQTVWLERLEAEIGNLRAAISWSLEAVDPEPGLRLCPALTQFWFTRGYYVEAGHWFDAATARLDGASPRLAGRVLRAAGRTALFLGDDDKARALLERALTVARESGDRETAAKALLSLGDLARARGDLNGAIESQEEALALSREFDDSYQSAIALHHLAESLRDSGDYPRARELFEESIRKTRESGDLLAATDTIHSLGDLALETGDLDRAAELYRESLGLAQEYEADLSAAYCLAGLAAAAAGAGALERAARLWGAVEALESDLGVRLLPRERVRYERVVQAACEDEPTALAAGSELDLQEAIELALRL
jgi:predicted ATPase/DNA-binding SARP family transcriptional activator